MAERRHARPVSGQQAAIDDLGQAAAARPEKGVAPTRPPDLEAEVESFRKKVARQREKKLIQHNETLRPGGKQTPGSVQRAGAPPAAQGGGVVDAIETVDRVPETREDAEYRVPKADKSSSHGGLLQRPPRRPDKHQAKLAGEYDGVRAELLTDIEALREKTATRFAPRFKAEIARRWRATAPENQEERHQLGEWITSELERMALVLWCPKTHLPAKLRISGRGDFQIVPHGWKNPSISRSDLLELLPYIYLMPVGSPGPTKAELYVASNAGRSFAQGR